MASELVNRIRAKYPEYNDIPDDELEKRILAKYPEYQDLAGKSNWLTNNAQSIPGKIWNAAGNILNLPSYALGGITKSRREALQSGDTKKALPNLFGDIKAAARGIKEKTPIMTELPQSFGMDPNSVAGMAVGFGGELLTPGLPISDIAKGIGIAGKGSKAVQGAGKLSEVGKDLLLRSYKFSQTDIAKLANNLGETNPAKYKDVVVNFLQKQNLTGGATQQGMESVSRVIDPVQSQYNALTKTGKVIDPRVYARQIIAQAQEILSNPLSTADELQIAKNLQAEAKRIGAITTPITDTMLTAKKSGSFAGVPASKINDPYLMSRQKAMGQAGIQALEEIAPGSQSLGRQLKGLRTAQEVIGRTANVGKGTQVINTLKAFVPGAGVGYMVSGGNPIAMLPGALAASMANNPAIQNKVARATLSFANRTGTGRVGKGLNLFRKGLSKTASTGARVSMQPKEQSKQVVPRSVSEQSQTTYQSIPNTVDLFIQQNEKRRKNYVPAAFPTVRRK